MRFKTLKFRRKKDFLYVLIMGVVLFLPLVLSITFGKYQTRESIKLVEGSISYIPYDFKIMAMYQENSSGEYQEINYTPTDGYKINEQKSYCTLDNINKDIDIILKTENGNHIFANLNKNAKCYIWFDKVSTIHDIIQTHHSTMRTDFSTTLTEDTTGTLFMAEDDYGISYYYAGAVQDNWVKFAGFFWRIIRVNGDGTLRMIYSGTEENGPSFTGEARQIGASVFNEKYYDNAYVGYMYTLADVHGADADSSIKIYLDNWYENNLKSYEKLIDTNAGFCNDRVPSTNEKISNNEGGVGNNITSYFGAYIRFFSGSHWIENPLPSFICNDYRDLFTSKNSIYGNHKLEFSIGLITIDEAIYGGSFGDNWNPSYYLYTGYYYWTMSPYSFTSDNQDAHMFTVSSGGGVGHWGLYGTLGVRPVINLKSDITFSSGNGTIDNPYVVN